MDLRVEAYRRYNNNNIYKVSLCMIKKDSIAYTDLSRGENIFNMEYENVGEIYVERCILDTFLSNIYVKELRTGKFIPLRREISYGDDVDNYTHKHSPIFVRMVVMYGFDKYFEHNDELKLAEDCILNDEELESYINSLSKVKIYDVKKKLDNLFDEAEKRYSEALSKNLVSDKVNVQTAKIDEKIKKIKKVYHVRKF